MAMATSDTMNFYLVFENYLLVIYLLSKDKSQIAHSQVGNII